VVQGDANFLEGIVQDLNTQSSAGVDGWTPKLIQMCYGTQGDGDGDKMAFRDFLNMYFISMASGTAPGVRLMTTARLTPLSKRVAGVRPITCGSMFYRIGMRYSMAMLRKDSEVDSYLMSTQLGVGSKGGIEPVVEWVQQQVDSMSEHDELYFVELDGKNAYNSLKQKYMSEQIHKFAPEFFKLAKWAYNAPATMIIADNITHTAICNSEGVRQGGPESGLFFSIGIRPIVEGLQETCGREGKVVSYLDNIYIVSTNRNVMDTAKHFCRSLEEETGFVLNEGKCKLIDLRAVKAGSVSLEILGTCIGSNEMRKAFLCDMISSVAKVIGRLKQLPKQHAFYLLRTSTSNKLRYLLRSMDLRAVNDQIENMDAIFYDTIDFLRAFEGERIVHETDIMGLPHRMGGLGMYSYEEIQPLARRASLAASRNELIQRGLSSKQFMEGLAEQMQIKGVSDDDNPYRQIGPTPTMEDEQQQNKTQKQLTREFMEGKFKKLMESLNQEQQLAFIDQMPSIKAINVLPGKHRSFTNQQVAAILNMLCLRRKHEGEVCQCGQGNSLNHFEVCPACDVIEKNNCYKHNAARDLYVASINNKNNETSKRLKASKEPRVYEEEDGANNNNNSRADVEVIEQAGQPQQNESTGGKLDFQGKAALSNHTAQARQKAETKAREEGITDTVKIRQKQLQAALQVGYDQKMRKYAQAKKDGIVVTPLVFSSGGTMHKIMYKIVKKTFPDSNQRSWLLLDIAVCLLRARAQIYARELHILEESAAAANG